MNELESLVLELDKIAALNEDEFRYKVTIEPNYLRTRSGFVYIFFCHEKAEGHTFLCGSGVTLDEAVKQAKDSGAEACEAWGYKRN